MEFLLTLPIYLLLVGGLVAAVSYGRAPIWRPDRRKVLALMQQLQQGQARGQSGSCLSASP